MSAETKTPEMVKVIVDGEEHQVAAGQNLIEVVKQCGGEVPHYCYHPHLSVAGNCRMCQVEVVGMPKLTIACNTQVRDGMEVKTHKTSQQVVDAQAATLEFLLINHPLDCTVCDQAGHCKLQDYHYEYNARPSRFLEDKVKQIKAFPLGPTVNLDGERCISCTRCVRFCDEVTGTSELGLINRGDRSVIAVTSSNPLDNPFSGTVVDLCPVGALTHREWRFNTRIWFTEQYDSICPGCSTGCNVRVATRDGEVVQVKARLNAVVNKEWLCDEGRYGLSQLANGTPFKVPHKLGTELAWESLAKEWQRLPKNATTLFILAGDLTLEDYLAVAALKNSFQNADSICNLQSRELSDLEAILISPDRAPNFMGYIYAGLGSGDLADQYEAGFKKLLSGGYDQVLLFGDGAVSEATFGECGQAQIEVALTNKSVWSFVSSADSPLFRYSVAVPVRSVLQRAGLMFNRRGRLQYLERVLPIDGLIKPLWSQLRQLEVSLQAVMGVGPGDRDVTQHILKQDERLSGITLREIKVAGVDCSHLF